MASRAVPAHGSRRRPATVRSTGCAAERPKAPRCRRSSAVADGRPRRPGRRRRRPQRSRRPAAADLHLLPSRAATRGPGRPHAADPRRADHGRDRSRLSRPRADDGQAPRPCQGQDPPRRHPVPRAAGAPAARAHRRGTGRSVPALQRGLCRHCRRRPRAPGPVRRSHPPGPHPRHADARRARGARPALAHAAAPRPAGCPDGRRGADHPRGPGPRPLGREPRSTRALPTWTRRCGTSAPGPTSFRRRSRPVTPPRRTRRTPTGRRSRCCTSAWRSWCPPPSSS